MRGPKNPDELFMREALRLARKGYGRTSPNPMVGAVLVRAGKIIGQGWHHRAGLPHAEMEALNDARRGTRSFKDATLYVTLEPCSTFGRTPPCSTAILEAGIRRVVVAATDPNPKHAGRGLELLREGGVEVVAGILESEAALLNESFNHWIVRRLPFVVLKSAMTLDGKIATASGQSKWITGPKARAWTMKLRRGMDAILVGVNTVIADDPSLTCRASEKAGAPLAKTLRRFVLDPNARTPTGCRLLNDDQAEQTTVIVSAEAPKAKVRELRKRVQVWEVAASGGAVDLPALLARMGAENITALLVEGGGETHAHFLNQGQAQRVCFLYAPKIIGGRNARKGVGGPGIPDSENAIRIEAFQSRMLGPDLLVTGRIQS